MPRFTNTRHPLVMGMVVGALQAQSLDAVPELAPEEEREEGDDYLPACILTVDGERWRISVEAAE